MVRIALVLCLVPGCLTVSAKRKPSRPASVAAAAVGVTIAGAALAGAHASSDTMTASQPPIAIGTSLIPMAGLYLGEEPPEATTPGGIYSNLLSGMGNAAGASLLFLVPTFGTVLSGDKDAENDDEHGALYGTVGGVLVGTVASVALGNYLPKWGRVVVGALVTGSFATLGYHLGDR